MDNLYSDQGNQANSYNNLYGNFNRALNPLVLQALRSQIKNGQMDQNTAQSQAVSSFGDLSNNVKYNEIFNKNITNQLYSNLGTSAGLGNSQGQFGQYDPNGNFQQQTTALHKFVVSNGGMDSSVSALRGGLTSNPDTVNSIQQFDNPSPISATPTAQPGLVQSPISAAPPNKIPQQSGVATSYLNQSKALQSQLGNPGQIINY